MFLNNGFSILGRGGLSGQRGTSLTGRSLMLGAGTGVSWSPPSPSLQEEPMQSSLSEPQDLTSLEKTDISHSRRAPATQGDGMPCSNGNGIKTETLEDD